MSQAEQQALAKLQRHFGGRVDADVLASVLAVCDGNVDQAIQFLTAGADHVVEDPNRANQDSVPKDYPGQRASGSKPVSAKAAVKVANDAHDRIQNTKRLFLGEHTVTEHGAAALANTDEYVATLLLLLNQSVEIAKNARPRCLAALRGNAVDHILARHSETFGLPEVLRALELLDAPRRIRMLERKLVRLEAAKAKAGKASQIKASLNDLKREIMDQSSVSGSLALRVRKWIKTIPAETLTFFALQLPKEPWQALADIVHVHKDDFLGFVYVQRKLIPLIAPWFLDVVFGKEAPEDSLLKVSQTIDIDNIEQVLRDGHKVPYSYIRSKVRPLSDAVKALIASYTPLDTLIWYHEELVTPAVNDAIAQRLQKGETPQFSYGKLMERLMYFERIGAPFYSTLVPVAEKRLSGIELLLEPPVAVLGDASYSMDVAIRTATIIASVLTLLSQAELKFFNVTAVDAPFAVRNVRDVLAVAKGVKADGLTASASALWPYYQAKKPVKFFLVVTDEIENNKFQNNYYFPDLFKKYYEEVYPAKLVFVSFLENPSNKGRMVKSLENIGFDVLQFRLDGSRPDLTKMDTLLGLLSSESSFFPEQVLKLSEILTKGGLGAMVDRMLNPPQRPQAAAVRYDVVDEKAEKERDKEKEKEEQNRKKRIENVPEHFTCPITLDLMTDPVSTPAGHTYERSAIEDHIRRTAKDPMTNDPLVIDDLRPNRNLRDAIAAFRKEHGV